MHRFSESPDLPTPEYYTFAELLTSSTCSPPPRTPATPAPGTPSCSRWAARPSTALHWSDASRLSSPGARRIKVARGGLVFSRIAAREKRVCRWCVTMCFSVAGWRCCPASRLSVASAWSLDCVAPGARQLQKCSEARHLLYIATPEPFARNGNAWSWWAILPVCKTMKNERLPRQTRRNYLKKTSSG